MSSNRFHFHHFRGKVFSHPTHPQAVDTEVGGVVAEGGAGGAGADGEAEGAEDAVAGGAVPFHVGAGAAVEVGFAGGELAEFEGAADVGDGDVLAGEVRWEEVGEGGRLGSGKDEPEGAGGRRREEGAGEGDRVGEAMEGDASPGGSGIDVAGERVGDHAEEGAFGGAEGDVDREAGTPFEEGRGAVERIDQPKKRPGPPLGVGRQFAFLADDREIEGTEDVQDGAVRGKIGRRDRGAIGFGPDEQRLFACIDVAQQRMRTGDRSCHCLCPQEGELCPGNGLHGSKIRPGPRTFAPTQGCRGPSTG